MSNIIDSIQLSGTVYTISGGGGSPTVELTQAEYDALVTAGTVAEDTYYIITDAQAGDLTQYWTSAQTQSAINQATSGKVDTSAITSSVTSASTDSEIPTAKAVYTAVGQGGGGEGKPIEGGRGITVTTGATADTVSFNLAIYDRGNTSCVSECHDENSNVPICRSSYCHLEQPSGLIGSNSNSSHKEGAGSKIGDNSNNSHVEGYNCEVGTLSPYSHAEGQYTKTSNQSEHASGQYNASSRASYTFGNSGNTLFSVGNGTSTSARHNAFEIRQNGDIYLTLDGQDVKLQDNLFSGNYNDLSNKPTNVSAFNNDAGYITSDAISGKADTSAVTESINAAVSGKVDTTTYNTYTAATDTALASKQTTLTAGTGISIVDNVISATGGSSVNVVQTTGTSTTDVMSQDAVTSVLSEKVNISDNNVSAFSDFKVALESGKDYTSDNISTFYLGTNKTTTGNGDIAIITTTDANYPTITIHCDYSNGNITQVRATGGITSSVENGVAQITLTGGTLATVVSASNGGVVFLYKQYTSGQTADVVEDTVYDALKELSNNKLDYIYKDETINSKKTFLWGSTGDKPIIFKQTNNEAKLGFICKNSASTNNELATFEFRPDTYTDSSSVKHPLLYLGHYRNNNTANAGVPQTMVGFRQYDQKGGAAYHYLMPLPAEAKTPFSLTASFKNYFAPLGFKNGSTMITADNTGVVDLSSELGGLKLKKLTQAEYDALATKDNSTLYVIVN